MTLTDNEFTELLNAIRPIPTSLEWDGGEGHADIVDHQFKCLNYLIAIDYTVSQSVQIAPTDPLTKPDVDINSTRIEICGLDVILRDGSDLDDTFITFTNPQYERLYSTIKNSITIKN